jgi:hypothetical protein
MSRPRERRFTTDRRRGAVAVMVAVLLTALLGLLGLVLDTGLLLARHRQTHNAADAAALAAAMDMLRGRADDARRTADTFAARHGATIDEFNIPPLSGPYAQNPNYVEVYTSATTQTLFMQILGVEPSRTVRARAVAGFEAVSAGEGVAVLHPTASPALKASGAGSNNGALRVNGRVVVNSNSSTAASAGNNFPIEGVIIDIVGGVNNTANFKPYHAGDPPPLRLGQFPEPDPLINLKPPSVSRGVDPTARGTVSLSGSSASLTFPNHIAVAGEKIGSFTATGNGKEAVLHPGIYTSLAISNNWTAVLVPGIYILRPPENTQTVLSVGGDGRLIGEGVLIYNASSDYNAASPTGDGSEAIPAFDSKKFSKISVSGTVQLDPINTSTINYQQSRSWEEPQPNGSPITRTYQPHANMSNAAIATYDGMLFFQHRWNRHEFTVTGSSSQSKMNGTVYSANGAMKLTGQGTYDAQFIVSTLDVTGNGNVTILSAGKGRGKANQVFLVE